MYKGGTQGSRMEDKGSTPESEEFERSKSRNFPDTAHRRFPAALKTYATLPISQTFMAELVSVFR